MSNATIKGYAKHVEALSAPGPWEVVPFGLCFMVRRTWPRPHVSAWGNRRVEVMTRPDGEVRSFKSEAAARAAITKAK